MNAYELISEVVQAHAETLPAEQQIPLYRALAELTADEARAAKLIRVASALEQVAAAQLSLRLRPAKRGAYRKH